MKLYHPWALAFVMVISLSIGFYVECLPLPTMFTYFKPSLMMIVGLYWVLAFPSSKAFGIAFLLCMLIDHVHGISLGIHGMCVLPIIYLVMLFHRQLRMLPVWQMAVWVTLFIIGSRSLYFVLTKPHIEHLELWVSGHFVHILVWPLVYSILRFLRQSCGRSQIYHDRFSIGP